MSIFRGSTVHYDTVYNNTTTSDNENKLYGSPTKFVLMMFDYTYHLYHSSKVEKVPNRILCTQGVFPDHIYEPRGCFSHCTQTGSNHSTDLHLRHMIHNPALEGTATVHTSPSAAYSVRSVRSHNNNSVFLEKRNVSRLVHTA